MSLASLLRAPTRKQRHQSQALHPHCRLFTFSFSSSYIIVMLWKCEIFECWRSKKMLLNWKQDWSPKSISGSCQNLLPSAKYCLYKKTSDCTEYLSIYDDFILSCKSRVLVCSSKALPVGGKFSIVNKSVFKMNIQTVVIKEENPLYFLYSI